MQNPPDHTSIQTQYIVSRQNSVSHVKSLLSCEY